MAKKTASKRSAKKSAGKVETPLPSTPVDSVTPPPGDAGDDTPARDPVVDETPACDPVADPAPKGSSPLNGRAQTYLRRTLESYYGTGNVPADLATAAEEGLSAGKQVLLCHGKGNDRYTAEVLEDFDPGDTSKDVSCKGVVLHISRVMTDAKVYP